MIHISIFAPKTKFFCLDSICIFANFKKPNAEKTAEKNEKRIV